MKSSYALASKYGNALINSLKQKNALSLLETYLKEISKLSNKIENNEDFKFIINNPLNSKREVVCLLIGKDNSLLNDEIYLGFLSSVVEKRRENLIPMIYNVLETYFLELNKTVNVKIISSQEFSENSLKLIDSSLKESTGRKVKIEKEVNDSLIGGLQIFIEDKMFDYSVKGYLDSLKHFNASNRG